MTPIKPNMIANPNAAINKTAPILTPLNIASKKPVNILSLQLSIYS